MTTTVVEGRHLEEVTHGAVLTRGLGRSYGDASLPAPGRRPVASSVQADRVLAFEEETGRLHAEAGLSVGAIADLFLPRGFFLPVTPGTRAVTLGGMIAADVHGKNHHVAGTIARSLHAVRLRLPDGRIEDATDDSDSELFRATTGGMGLTGHILDATLTLERVPSRSILEEARTFSDLESLVDGLLEAGRRWPFTVAWSDFLAPRGGFGRGILYGGRWAEPAEGAPAGSVLSGGLRVPFDMPSFLLGNAGLRAFNALRYERARRSPATGRPALRDAGAFFYPLDAIEDWNLLYGRRGFTQYQCVLPPDPSMRSYRHLAEVARSGGPGPFLAVLKDCGEEGTGLLSFPMPGVSFALDFPVHDGTGDLVARLNEIVADAGGRVYLAKDAFTTASMFARMEPRLAAFRAVRDRIDPDRAIDSALARRLLENAAD